ncbi:MAG: hypothetical protein P8101_00785 [Candidatus Thiodiazotropha sp.]|jgi:hypothetical protein
MLAVQRKYTIVDQDEFVNRLLTESDQLSAGFIIWFSLIDYDALWDEVLGQDDFSVLESVSGVRM